MSRTKTTVMGTMTAVVGMIGLSVYAADISIDQLPVKAKAALLKLAGDHPILEVESEKEHGIMVYEAAWEVDGNKVEAEVTADGVLLEMEEKVAAADVPAAVRDAAASVLGNADNVRYERHTEVFYEVKGTVDGKGKEIKISPGGKVMGHDDDGDDHDGHDHDGDDDDGEE